MSDHQNKKPEGPKKSTPGDSEGGVNWKVIILFTLAFAVIWGAFKYGGASDSDKLTFPEFRKAFLEGRVLRTASEDIKKGQLELITFSGETRAEIRGKYHDNEPFLKEWTNQTSVKINVQLGVHGEELESTFGERLLWEKISNHSN